MKHCLRFGSFWAILWVLCSGPLAVFAQTNYFYDLNTGTNICAESPGSTSVGNGVSGYAVLPRTLDNVTFSALTHGSGLACGTGGSAAADGGYNTTSYTTGGASRNANEYIEFSITPSACFDATVNSVKLILVRSGTGPPNYAFTYKNGAGAETDASTGTVGTGATTINITINQLIAVGGSIRFRVYGWGGTGGTGTLRIVGANNEATQRTSVNITTVATGPAVPVAPATTSPGCANVQVSYTAAQITGLPADVTYYWQGTNSAGTSTTTPFTNPGALSQTVTLDGTYYIRARNTAGCWSATSRAITVNVLADGGTAGLWTGAVDADWNNCRNWSNGTVPGFLADVSITGTPTNLPNNIPDFTILNSLTLNENAAGNTQLAAGATLTLNTLTLTNGKLNLNGGNLSIASELPGAIAGGNTNAYLYNGTLNRGVWNAAANTVYNFPVGDATRYRLLRYTQTNVRNLLDLVSVTWNTGAYTSPAFISGNDGFTEFAADFKYDFQEGTWNITSNFGNDAYDLEVFPNWASSTWCGGSNCDAYTLLKASSGTFNNGTSTPVAADGGAWDTNPTTGASNGISAAGGIKRTGYTSFSDILVVGTGNQPFPVEMLSFTGEWQGQDAVLTWRTAQETNNLGFAVERSTNGRDFAEVGFVAGAGSHNSVSAYTFTDASPAGAGAFFYRLRQQDFDGTETYTAAIELRRSATPRLVLYPNPTTASVTVDAQGIDPDASATVEVFGTDGRRLLRFAGSFSQVAEDTHRHFGHLAPGFYTLRLVVDGFVTQQPVAKQ